MSLLMKYVLAAFFVAAPLSAVQAATPAKVGEAPAAVTAEAPAKVKRPLTPGQQAARERQRTCAGQWKVDKVAGKTGGLTWPKYWSACNKRLKGAKT